MTEKNTLYCSFCGKSQHQVRKLVAGPTVFICDKCILLCFDILVEEKIFGMNDLSKEALLRQREMRIDEVITVAKNILEADKVTRRRFDILEGQLRELEPPVEVPKPESRVEESNAESKVETT